MGNFTKAGEIWITGTVKTLKGDKGFGFILGTEGVEYFFHHTDAPDFEALTVGTAVRFKPRVGNKGPRAEQVEVL